MEPAAIERARRDVAEDRPWKARERLRSYLKAHPADQPARELLGEVEWAMRNVPAAGAAWFLTERDDEPAREAIAVLQSEHRRTVHALIAALGVRAPLEAWPPAVQARLRELDAAARTGGEAPWTWPSASDDGDAEDARDDSLFALGTREHVGIAGCLLGLLATAGSAFVGAVTVVRWLADRLR